jgi:hypothetical protein
MTAAGSAYFVSSPHCGTLAVGMSLIVAVKDEQDVVIASDGRVLAEDASVMSNDSLKTLALHDALCLGIAGPTKSMRHVLGALGLKCGRVHPADIIRVCQDVGCPIDVDYADAHRELIAVIRWIARRSPAGSLESRVPPTVLAGRRGDVPTLCSWTRPTWRAVASPSQGFSGVSIGPLPDRDSDARTRYDRLVRGDATTHNGERRLADAVRFCAHYFGDDGPINATVFTRRLTQGFRLMQEDDRGAP